MDQSPPTPNRMVLDVIKLYLCLYMCVFLSQDHMSKRIIDIKATMRTRNLFVDIFIISNFSFSSLHNANRFLPATYIYSLSHPIILNKHA